MNLSRQNSPGRINMKNYPDISDILSAKDARRKKLASLSWEEKVAIIDKMRKVSISKARPHSVKENSGIYKTKSRI